MRGVRIVRFRTEGGAPEVPNRRELGFDDVDEIGGTPGVESRAYLATAIGNPLHVIGRSLSITNVGEGIHFRYETSERHRNRLGQLDSTSLSNSDRSVLNDPLTRSMMAWLPKSADRTTTRIRLEVEWVQDEKDGCRACQIRKGAIALQWFTLKKVAA